MVMNQYASPNLWDQTSDAKANLLKGVQGLRPVVQQADYYGNSKLYGDMGLAAQQNAMGLLGAQATGQAPSIANLQMQQGIDANNRAAFGLLSGARGGNVAGAYGQALGAQSAANANAAQQAAINRLAEQQAALGQYAQMGQGLSQQGLGYAGLGLQNALGQDQNALGWYGAKRGMDLQQRGQDRQFYGGLIDSMAGMTGGLLAGVSSMSDERTKEGLGLLAPGEAGAAVGEVQPVAWDHYTDPSMGPPGPHTGVSAQQLAGTRLGGLVQPGPDGLLRVDAGGAATTALAASADQEHRLRALESQVAQQDPYASPQMRKIGGDYEVALGRQREIEAQRLSDEIAAARGSSQVQRGRRDGGLLRGQFDGVPQMQRDVDPQYAAITRSPAAFSDSGFRDEQPSPFGPEPVERTGLLPRARPRRRGGLVQVEQRGGGLMRAQPVADDMINYDRLAPIEPYRPGSARTLDYNTMTGRKPVVLDPASQRMLDAQHDYLNEYTMEVRGDDGTSRRVMIPDWLRERMDAPVPVDLQRQIDQMQRDDEIRAIEDERARRAAIPQRMVF